MQKEAIALAAQIAYKNNANVSLSLNLKQIAIIILWLLLLIICSPRLKKNSSAI